MLYDTGTADVAPACALARHAKTKRPHSQSELRALLLDRDLKLNC